MRASGTRTFSGWVNLTLRPPKFMASWPCARRIDCRSEWWVPQQYAGIRYPGILRPHGVDRPTSAGNRPLQSQAQSFRTKVTLRSTRQPKMAPFSTCTCCPATQAPFTFSTLYSARSMPCRMASSKPVGDSAVISITLATLTSLTPECKRFPAYVFVLRASLINIKSPHDPVLLDAPANGQM